MNTNNEDKRLKRRDKLRKLTMDSQKLWSNRTKEPGLTEAQWRDVKLLEKNKQTKEVEQKKKREKKGPSENSVQYKQTWTQQLGFNGICK